MRFDKTYTLQEIGAIINAEFVGDPNHSVLGLNEIHVVDEGDIVFVDHPKYYDKALNSKATTILINKKVKCPKGKALLISDDPFRDFNKLSRHFQNNKPSILRFSETSKIDTSSYIAPGVFVGNHVTIGKNCKIHPNVVLYDYTQVGDNVTIHAGSVIGADAFYYKNRPEGFDQLNSCGKVVIEDHVDIGANCTIDRGVTEITRIGKGSKLDNGIQVGHDTKIGEKCLIAAHVAIAGCTIIENNVTLWGQVGITSGVTIQEDTVIYAQSGVSQSLKTGKYFGSPADNARTKYKELASLKILPQIIEDLNRSEE